MGALLLGTLHASTSQAEEPGVPIVEETVVNVRAKRRLIHPSSSTSRTELVREQIIQLPQGSEVSLPKLLTTTTPGVVAGPFGQMFFRGNHANIQYQIDGVQLPDSPSNSFGQAISPRNIETLEVITGGIPAEYGQRLSAVVNIVTQSGPEEPGGEIELNYGSYNTITPHLLLGGSDSSGTFHYFFSANYNQTDRGLDTPQPASVSEQGQGGKESVHNFANGDSEFAKLDWYVNNSNKVTWILFHSQSFFEIPNFPSSFSPQSPFFSTGFMDSFGNQNPDAPTYAYVPSNTNDRQTEINAYTQLIWSHTLSERSFLRIAPYYKYSLIRFDNDLQNDLAAKGLIVGARPVSFTMNRHVNNLGLKADYSLRPDDVHLIKAGVQVQVSRSDGGASFQSDLNTPPLTDGSPNTGYLEGIYVQDDIRLAKPLILNVGLRLDAAQFDFSGQSSSDYLVQPRLGLNYLVTDSTKLHFFYGKLFQPAPVEHLRVQFNNTGDVTTDGLKPYDIKAEKDDYFEVGVAQQLGDHHAVSLNVYYKDGENILDDTQLLNTSIAQPYNFATGFAYGVELSLKGQLTSDWSEYANYSYQIAKGKGISGGILNGVVPSNEYQFLDHVQVHTVNAGLTYSKDFWWWSGQGVYGSGLRTGPDNSLGLPSHLTFDTTLGYQFHGQSWLSRFRVSFDVLNVLDNVYPITIANGYNGSHYAAGRQFFVRLGKAF